ncbi:single-stranded DNA-binding protein [Pediococcus pentosaceus]|uniref:single-stranded DNA-binding protein n=1 Tax=Pediococcus pentosaceus TaxID=1255 RepID=UPI0013305A94|nr:single-stranded DNA-binding protein [Pediococcus pentosaceus]KAF0349743.1 single-stranded DNA-binding protein [Pediococcus pentosaceus]MBF7105698.1 single-stranded DNA-binding protein [Pediococcus pentosaceus]
MINRAVLVGRLTNGPELKYTGSGVAVATFTVAVNRQFTNSQGEREADFIRCQMWRKAAENFCNFTRKGSLVGIDGRIQTRSYENQQGTRIFVTEVVAENFSLLESKNSSQNEQFEQNRPKNNGQNYQNKQNGQSSPSRNPNNPFNSMPDIKDDDLPF